jgi:hypothetical protein
MEEVIGSIPIRSTNHFSNLGISSIFLKGPERSNKRGCFTFPDFLLQHPCYFRLRLPLGRGDRLRVHLQRHLDSGVPEQLLHRLDVLAVCLQQRRKSAPEGMPSDVFQDLLSLPL